ncbi:MAG: hypothetical protein GY754_14550 [bacterium]|nr:hypothetical protein [bacterium]
MNHLYKIILVPLLLAACSFLAAVSGNNRLFAYERLDLLDGRTAIVFHASNMEQIKTAIYDSPLGELVNSREMELFFNGQSLFGALGQFMKTSFSEENKKDASSEKRYQLFMKSLSYMKKELVLGITPTDNDDVKMFTLFEMNEKDFNELVRLGDEISELDPGSSITKKTSFQGVTVYESIEKDKNKGEVSSWSAHYGNTMIFSSERSFIEKCIVKLKKELPVNITRTPFVNFKLSYTFIDRIVKELENDFSKPGNKPGMPGGISAFKVMEALGLDHFREFNLRISFKPKTMELDLNILKAPGKQGIWALFNDRPIPRSHRLAYVPKDVYSYQVYKLDIKNLWSNLPAILNNINPQLAMQFRMGIDSLKGMLQVDVSKDFLENHDDMITAYSRLDNLQKQDIVAFQLRNPQLAEKALKKLFAKNSPLAIQFRAKFESSTYMNHTLYTITPSGFPMGKTAPGNQANPVKKGKIQITVADDALVIGDDVLVRSLVKASAGKETSPFYQSAFFTQSMQTVPAHVMAYGMSDLSVAIKQLVEIVKHPAFIQGFRAGVLSRSSKMGSRFKGSNPLENYFVNLQFNKLPSRKFIASFFGRTTSYSQYEETRVSSKTVIYYPRKKK